MSSTISTSQDLDDIKIIFACGECTFATTDRSELDAHLTTVHEKSELIHYDNATDTAVLPSSQPTTLQYVSPGQLVLAPITSQVIWYNLEFDTLP